MAIVVKRQGRQELFDERKLYASIYAACTSANFGEKKCEKVAENICKKVIKFMSRKKKISSIDLRKKVEAELKKIDAELAFFYEQHLPNLKEL